MAKSLLNLLGGGAAGAPAILMQAVGAYMRGETPQDFMKKLAKTLPELNGLDLDDLEGTANKLAQQKGTTVDEVAKTVKQKVGAFM